MTYKGHFPNNTRQKSNNTQKFYNIRLARLRELSFRITTSILYYKSKKEKSNNITLSHCMTMLGIGSRVLENYHSAHTQKCLTMLGNKKAPNWGLSVTRLSLANH